MKRFRLLEGTHQQNGRTFVKGDLVESNFDLVQMFGRERFAEELSHPSRRPAAVAVVEDEPEEEVDPAPVPVKKGKKLTEDTKDVETDDDADVETDAEDDADDEEGDVTSSYGEDVSVEFLMAEGKGVTVYLDEDGTYTLVKGEEVLAQPSSKTAVKKFLKDME